MGQQTYNSHSRDLRGCRRFVPQHCGSRLFKQRRIYCDGKRRAISSDNGTRQIRGILQNRNRTELDGQRPGSLRLSRNFRVLVRYQHKTDGLGKIARCKRSKRREQHGLQPRNTCDKHTVQRQIYNRQQQARCAGFTS